MSGRKETIVNKSNSSHTISESSPRVAGLTIQTASFGLTIPIIYGRSRIAANLVWLGNFLTQSHSETTVTSSTPEQVTTTRGGKFGKTTTTITPASQTTQTTITYVYFASPVFSLGEGPIAGLHAMWREKTKLGANGWGEFFTQTGAIGQAALSFLGDQTIAYSGLALAYANNTELTSNGGLPTFSFEVNGKLQETGDGVNVNPASVLLDLASNPAYGAGFGVTPFASLTGYSDYCRAMGFFMSPCYDTQVPFAQMVQEICAVTNAAIFSSQGALKIVPYADAQVSGNGATYTPTTTPLYDLDDNDFLEEVRCMRRTPADCFNSIRLEYLDAAQDYAIAIAEASDQAHIEANGSRPMEPINSHAITNAALARKVAQLLLQRQLYVVNEYTFPLPWNYALLEPMDLVTLTDAGLGLNKLPVRITGVEEDGEGNLMMTAEDYPFGIASVSVYPDHPGLAISVDYNAAPGNVLAPQFFEPPIEFTTDTLLDVRAAVTGSSSLWGGCHVWFSLDGDEYRQIGTIVGGALYGSLTAALDASSGGAAVSLVGRGGQLLNVPVQDAQNLASLCWVAGVDAYDGGEFFAYETASLTGANAYTLGGLIRGAYQSNQRAKPAGTKFARLDANVIASGPLQRSNIGKPTYWKFSSFNIYGGGRQALQDVVEYTYTVTGNMVLLPPADVQTFTIDGTILSWLPVPDIDLAGYELRFHYGNNGDWGTATPMSSGLITASPYDMVMRPDGIVTVMIKAIDTTGNASITAALIVANLGDAPLANVVETITFDPVFAGTLENGTVIGGDLQAGALDSFYENPVALFYGADTDPFYLTSAYGAMVYTTADTRIASALAGSVATLLIDYAGSSLLIEYRQANPAPKYGAAADSFYGPDAAEFYPGAGVWMPWPGQMTAMNDVYQFRFTIGSGEVQGRINALALVIDAPDMLESVNDLSVSAAGTAIPYTKAFAAIKNIQATLQANGTGAVTVEIDKTSPLAPTAKCFNAAHTAVGGATVDFYLKGY